MAIRADITAAAEWHLHENKTLRVACFKEDGTTPLDLSLLAPGDIEWRLIPRTGSAAILIHKTSDAEGGITLDPAVPANNVALIAIASDADYEDVPAGIHHHELWDRDNNVLLAYGAAVLQPSTAKVTS